MRLNVFITDFFDCLISQDMRAVAGRKERERQKEAAKIEQKMKLDKLKQQVLYLCST